MFPNGMIPTRSIYIFPNGMIWKEGLLAVFWWVSRARAERRRGRRATGPPARGRSRWRGAPRCETPGGPLDGRRERVGPPRGGSTAFPADPRSPALARCGRLRLLLAAIRLCILLFQLAIPCASFLAASPFDVRKYTRHHDNAVTFLV